MIILKERHIYTQARECTQGPSRDIISCSFATHERALTPSGRVSVMIQDIQNYQNILNKYSGYYMNSEVLETSNRSVSSVTNELIFRRQITCLKSVLDHYICSNEETLLQFFQ